MLKRWIALLLVVGMLMPLAGCTDGPRQAPVARDDSSSRGPYAAAPPQQRPGLSTKQKVGLLVGAAALYYLYNKHKNKQGTGPEGQYYRSRNGRIYYRDAQGRAHWVTPPSEGIRVPQDEYERYSRYSDTSRWQ